MAGTSAGNPEQLLHELSALARELRAELAPGSAARTTPRSVLAPAQLDIARSLFNTLRQKHGGTAKHSARVLLGCSHWSERLGISDQDRDAIELAALLHDVGKIGVPERILQKPGRLTPEEVGVMQRCRQMGLELVKRSLALPDVVDVVSNVQTWFDGSRSADGTSRESIPLGSRMLAIMDAFDAMTTDQSYRPAMSIDRAISELTRNAGTQFDPDLVRVFAEASNLDPQRLQAEADDVLQAWGASPGGQSQPMQTLDSGLVVPAGGGNLFQQHLLDTMNAAVLFVNQSLRIIYWNPAAERLTGFNGEAMLQRRWEPGLLGMRDEKGYVVRHEDCPLIKAVELRQSGAGRFAFRGQERQMLIVDVQATPVVGPDGSAQGATLLFQDATPAASLESRCRSLYERLTKDPLTQVANRAEFDRVLARTVTDHQQRDVVCSLVICDIDHFKAINDTFGHPAGDEVIKGFARLLERFARAGDLVARYGGEEFVVLYPDCDLKTATERAEELRKGFSELTYPALGERQVTASFGVTESQAEDNPATFLRRADAALYCAKDQGRNAVVPLTGGGQRPDSLRSKSAAADKSVVAEQWLGTNVTLPLVVDKLRGFVDDNQMEIVSIQGNHVELRTQASWIPFLRRKGDSVYALVVDLELDEIDTKGPSDASVPPGTATRLHVVIRTANHRDRRRSAAIQQANQLLVNFRAYLMVTDLGGGPKSPSVASLLR